MCACLCVCWLAGLCASLTFVPSLVVVVVTVVCWSVGLLLWEILSPSLDVLSCNQCRFCLPTRNRSTTTATTKLTISGPAAEVSSPTNLAVGIAPNWRLHLVQLNSQWEPNCQKYLVSFPLVRRFIRSAGLSIESLEGMVVLFWPLALTSDDMGKLAAYWCCCYRYRFCCYSYYHHHRHHYYFNLQLMILLAANIIIVLPLPPMVRIVVWPTAPLLAGKSISLPLLVGWSFSWILLSVGRSS